MVVKYEKNIIRHSSITAGEINNAFVKEEWWNTQQVLSALTQCGDKSTLLNLNIFLILEKKNYFYIDKI